MDDSGTSIIGVSLSFWEGPLVNVGVSSLPGDISVGASTISASGSNAEGCSVAANFSSLLVEDFDTGKLLSIGQTTSMVDSLGGDTTSSNTAGLSNPDGFTSDMA